MARKLATLQTRQRKQILCICHANIRYKVLQTPTTWAQRAATSENTQHAKRTGKQHGKPWTQLAVEFYVEGSSFTACAPFGNTSSVGCYSAVPAIICSSLHITSYCCYSYVSCILCSLLVCPLKLQQVEVTSWCLHCLLFLICTTGFYLHCCVCTAVNVLKYR